MYIVTIIADRRDTIISILKEYSPEGIPEIKELCGCIGSGFVTSLVVNDQKDVEYIKQIANKYDKVLVRSARLD